MNAENTSVAMPSMRPRGMSLFGSWDSSAAKRQLLDGEVEPHRERHGRQNAFDAKGQERPAALRKFHQLAVVAHADVESPAREIDLPGDDGASPEDGQHAECQQGHQHRNAERQFDPEHVEADEHDVHGNPPDWLKSRGGAEDAAEIRADEEYDDRGREDVLDVLRESGDESAPRTHRAARERVGGAGMRQGRGHLRQAETQANVHDADDDCGKEQPAEAARAEAEIPA